MKLLLCFAVLALAAHLGHTQTQPPAKKTLSSTGPSGQKSQVKPGGGGKLKVSKSTNPDDDKNAIELEFYSVKEKDNSGNEIGQGPNAGSGKTTNHTLAKKDLDKKNATIGNTMNVNRGTKPNGQPNSSQKTKSSVNLGGQTNLDMDVFVYGDNGKMVQGPNNGTEWETKEGDTGIDITLKNWGFCNNCNGGSQMGSMVEICMYMKSPQPPSKKAAGQRSRSLKNAEEYDVGLGGIMLMDSVIMCDNQWKNMSAGYPNVTTTGGKTLICFEFPKFNNNCTWDPTIQAASTGSARLLAASLLTLLLALGSTVC